MNKVELLSPAGDMQSLIAAVQAGADAVYLSGNAFGARSYAANFNYEELEKAINYAHIHNVLIYVTVNTLIFDDEFKELDEYLSFLEKVCVDAVIVQDLGVIRFIKKNHPNLIIHASTQINIFNKLGALNLMKMGVSRVVLAREVDIEVVKEIVSTGIEVEIFVHGALCFSSSGNCLFSSVIGGRSGNRGKCAQPCRKLYSLKENNNLIISNKALISTKDLMTLNNIDKIIESGAVSLKIEGRMKSPEYVYSVTKTYHEVINHYYQKHQIILNEKNINNLKVTFNREFTKGYLFNDDNANITNINSVNHLGLEIGKVIKCGDSFVDVLLSDEIALHDGLRILSKDEIGIFVTKILVNGKIKPKGHKKDIVRFNIKNNTSVGDVVVKTLDQTLKTQINDILKLENRKTLIDLCVFMFVGEQLKLSVKTSDGLNLEFVSNVLEYSDNSLSEERVKEQLSKLTSTPYEVKTIKIKTDNCSFVKVSDLNAIRRMMVEGLNNERLKKVSKNTLAYSFNNLTNISKEEVDIECVCHNDEQYEVCKKHQISNIYKLYDTYSGRLSNNSLKMIHNLGQLDDSSKVISPYFNLVNKEGLRFLEDYGIIKCYLGLELSIDKIKALNLEDFNLNVGIMAYGFIDLMVSKHCLVGKSKGCLNKKCMSCLNNKYSLIDEYHNNYPLMLEYQNDCTMRILDSKCLNLINEVDDLIKLGVRKFLLNFTTESYHETEQVIKLFKDKLSGLNVKCVKTNSGFLNKTIL